MKAVFTLGSLILSLGFAALAQAQNAPVVCSIQTYDGHFLSAVGGGGRTTDVIHSDARQVKSWEKFTLVDLGLGTPNITYGIKVKSDQFLSAVGGGGRDQDVIHSNASMPYAWEYFQFVALGGGYYAIQTNSGNYLTAVNGGGLIQDVIHSNATRVGSWEKFRLNCGI
jgi:hypothetical protein